MDHIIVLLSIIAVIAGASAFASDPALELGDYLFALQSYDEAITEYKRFLYFRPDDSRAADTLYKIGMAYRADQRWDKAIEAITASINRTTNVERKFERQIERAVTRIASGDYNLALLELITIESQRPPDQLRQRARFLQGVAYLYLFNFEQAREAFTVYFDATSGSVQKAEIIDALFDEAIHRPRKSEKVAEILSTILPGAGQIYAGHSKEGLNALILNGLIGFITADAVIDKRYDDAARALFFLASRYYLGNRYRAGEAAKQFNNREDHRHAAKILKVLTSEVSNAD